MTATNTHASSADATLPLKGAFSSGRELAKGLTFFIAMVGTISGINGLILLISARPNGRAVLMFSAAAWLAWFVARASMQMRERARMALPGEQIHLTSADITVPQISGKRETVRWIDVKEIRLTRDTAGIVYYEFYTGRETPALVLMRSRVVDAGALDHEIERRAGKIQQTFEAERATVSAPAPPTTDSVSLGERFDVSLPSTRAGTLRGCGALVLTLVVLTGLAFAFSEIATRWLSTGAGTVIVIAALIAGVLLAMRSPKAWIVGAADGLHVSAPGTSFPSFIAWSDLRDYTFVVTDGRHPKRNLTAWTSAGTWKLEGINIKNEAKLLSMLRQRSARKPNAFMERVDAAAQ